MLSKEMQDKAIEDLYSDDGDEWFDGLSPEEQQEVGDFTFSICTGAG
jgi:hypothetical protein